MWTLLAALAALLLGSMSRSALARGSTLHVGSKRFTESYILAEVVVAIARSEGIDAVHDQGLGGTAVTERALEDGAIDVYPEYTGTVAETIVHGDATVAHLRSALAPRGVGISSSLGFENRYALAISAAAAKRAGGPTRTSQLAEHPELRIGLSYEFAGRDDGWKGLAARYDLNGRTFTAFDHALAYEAIVRGNIDLLDVYTTDAKIARYDLVVLADDRRFFPPYDAVLLHRLDALGRFPAFGRVLARLEGAIDADTMRKLNARAELDGASFDQVAKELLGASAMDAPARATFLDGLLASIRKHGPRHLELVLGSVLFSTVLGIPLGVIAFSRRRVGAVVLGATGVIQTIPSLALFCFMIPLLGIGPVPALVALFLYGLLPIVQNTHAGLASIPGDLRVASLALGLSPAERLRHVELPLAARTILAGVRTSATAAVGSATIAAFIGAGGFGEPISTGLSLNDVPTILHGAIPAAGLALLVQGAFSLVERALVPAGLRVSTR